MRTQRTISSRLVPIGAILAAVAAMLVVTAAPALAANQPNGFNGGGDTVTVSATFISGTTYYVEFQTSTCSAAPAFAGTPSTVATAAGTSALTVAVPASVQVASGRSTTYKVCIWAISDLTTLVDGATTYTANIFDLILDTGMTAGPNGGGNTITAKTRLPGGSSPVTVLPPSAGYPAQFQQETGSSACAATYTSSNGPTVTASNVSSSAGSTLTLTVPSAAGSFPTTIPPVTAASPTADYNVCVYNGTSASSVLIAGTDNSTVAPYRVSIFSLTPLTPASGPSGGGNTIVATMPTIGLTAGTYYTQFQVGTACADTAAASSTSDTTSTASGTSLSVPVPSGVDGAPADTYRICVYAGTSGSPGGLLAQSAGAYTIAAYGLTLSSYATGQNSSNVTVTATLSGGTLPAAASVQFYVAAPCAATYTTPATSGTTGPFDGVLTLINSTKAAIAVPATVTANKLSYTVCIYAGSTNGSSALVASAATPYVVGTAVAITSVDVVGGPAQGGGTITLTGTFPASPATLTVTIGGTTATVTARNTTTVTFTVPAHTPGTFPIVVTTATGIVSNSAVTYTYSNGIVVTPQFAPGLPVATVIDVRGVGFTSLSFTDTSATAPNNTGAHVYLVTGRYDPSLATGSTTAKKNGQVAECVNVRVVSDTELVCTLYLGGNPTGYTHSLGTGCSFTGGSASLTSSSTCPVTTADIGSYISVSGGTGGTSVAITAGTTITAVSGTTVTLSRATGGTGTLTGGTTSLTTARDVTTGFTASGTTLTSSSTSSPVFSSADQGKVVTGTGIPDGTTITAVSSSGVATVSNSITGSPTSVHLYLTAYNAVADGVYTVTVVSTGALAPTTFSASIISSGSTFTVAAYR